MSSGRGDQRRGAAQSGAIALRDVSSQAMLDAAPDAIVGVDRRGVIIMANRQTEALFGYRPEELIGQSVDILVPERRRRKHGQHRAAYFGAPRTRPMGAGLELAGRRADGTEFPAEISLSSITTEGGVLALAAIRDVTEQRRVNEEINRLNRAQAEQLDQLRHAQEALTLQATHDALTGLPNRTLLIDRLEQALATARRTGHGTAIFFLDLDRFKQVNDTEGHSAGDALLVQVAAALRQAIRPMDTVARIGGDEFVILAPELEDVMDAVQLGERLAGVVRGLGVDRTSMLTASVGISVTQGGESTAETMLQEADVAMYHAKSRGRDRAAIFDAALAERATRWAATERSVRSALDRGGVRVHYQPLVELSTGSIVGVEALARLAGAGGAEVPPAEFISVAEEAGLIVALGAEVLRLACEDMLRWRNAVEGIPRSIRVAVNVSPRQMIPPGLVPLVREALARTGLPPGELHLEITETSLMGHKAEVVEELARLRDLGLEVGLDDFGTGYASLTHLRRLPISFLKIDRSFVAGLEVEPDDERIVTAVIDMAHGLGLRSIAEGVETPEQLAMLRRMGCDEAQGYLFSRPMDPDTLYRSFDELEARARAMVAHAPPRRRGLISPGR